MNPDPTNSPPSAVAEPAPAQISALVPGLYLVATPIGAARDISLRALDVLASADVLAAEDTRQTRKLLDIHGVRRGSRKLLPYHDHNGPAQRPRLLAALAAGQSVALVSDAGTPLIADPGYRLVSEAVAAGHPVFAVPGASAVMAALAVAGLPTDRFLFGGFLPVRDGARRRVLGELAAVPATLVFYDSPRRLADSLRVMAEVLGPTRPGAICRELTKRFEETRRETLGALAEHYAQAAEPKGEVVVVVGPPPPPETDEDTLDAALREALETQSLKDAAAAVAESLALPRRRVYARALVLTHDD